MTFLLYDNIIIDSANLFYRLQKENEKSNAIIKKMIAFIDDDSKKHLKQNGTIYLVFDPIGKNTLNEEKSFHVQTYSTRKNINSKYKAKRTYSSEYLGTIETLVKYYAYRGDGIKEVYSQSYEADDFIEPLIKMLNGDIALVSNDEDFARYIDEHTFLINKGYDQPWTRQGFYEKYKFYPTPAANTLYKAFYGDSSDNITGCIFTKKSKFMTNIRKTCYNVIKDVSEKGTTIDEFLDEVRHIDYQSLIRKENKTDLDLLLIEFSITSQKEDTLGKMRQNIKLIRSLLEGKDISKFIHSNPENKKFNDIIRQSIYGLDTKSWFGKVSV